MTQAQGALDIQNSQPLQLDYHSPDMIFHCDLSGDSQAQCKSQLFAPNAQKWRQDHKRIVLFAVK